MSMYFRTSSVGRRTISSRSRMQLVQLERAFYTKWKLQTQKIRKTLCQNDLFRVSLSSPGIKETKEINRNFLSVKDLYYIFYRQNVDNICCYDQGNNLIGSRFNEGGSLQRYHYLGGSGIIPYLHNFYFDILPFLYCCRYSENNVEVLNSTVEIVCPCFFTYRNISSCVNYDPPRPGDFTI